MCKLIQKKAGGKFAESKKVVIRKVYLNHALYFPNSFKTVNQNIITFIHTKFTAPVTMPFKSTLRKTNPVNRTHRLAYTYFTLLLK